MPREPLELGFFILFCKSAKRANPESLGPAEGNHCFGRAFAGLREAREAISPQFTSLHLTSRDHCGNDVSEAAKESPAETVESIGRAEGFRVGAVRTFPEK